MPARTSGKLTTGCFAAAYSAADLGKIERPNTSCKRKLARSSGDRRSRRSINATEMSCARSSAVSSSKVSSTTGSGNHWPT